jgi:hypothetical protein
MRTQGVEAWIRVGTHSRIHARITEGRTSRKWLHVEVRTSWHVEGDRFMTITGDIPGNEKGQNKPDG